MSGEKSLRSLVDMKMMDNSVLSSYYIVLIKLNMRRLDKMISVIPWNNIIDGPRGFEELA